MVVGFITTNAENVITLTTTRTINQNVQIGIHAMKGENANVWLDLNNNEIRDDKEGIRYVNDTKKQYYKLGAQTVTIHGKVVELDCSNCRLTTLDISQNNLLTNLNCRKNQLQELNISNNSFLKVLKCRANTNNTNLYSCQATGNENLICIQIDENCTIPENWEKDITAIWSKIPCKSDITKTDSENAVEINVWTQNKQVYISNLETKQIVTISDISGKIITTQTANSNEISILLEGGFYIVKAGNNTFKIIITE